MKLGGKFVTMTPAEVAAWAEGYQAALLEAMTETNRLPVPMKCQHCEKEYLAGAFTNKRTNSMYCSNKCRVAAQRARARV
jgi:hypothetical protein